ncbi:TIGR03790 family protein [Methyloterricola oryzae]|uniref:TIGR03790 family protein n=1 Tax=Methyloterricola oryzae TaxID=1495050 RepID=UPI0005EB2914|nr:TIGR03790 family protein [Methyloterricola oryzae]
MIGRLPLLLVFVLAWAGSALAVPAFELGRTGLEPRDLAVVINEDDPISVKSGEYYAQRRGIPSENLVRVRFPYKDEVLSRGDFQRLKSEVDRLTPSHVQAYALAWTTPYRVDCMSITAAFTFGFDPAYCSRSKCGTTKASPYFNSPSRAPHQDLAMRPSMMLAGQTYQDVKALIDRGISADFTYPRGTGYLVNTKDKNRSVRSVYFDEIVRVLGDAIKLERVDADAIRSKRDVMFYFTGAVSVPGLSSLQFLPGAIADHLTSTGGALTSSKQMSVLRWLEAGATGSYGTAVEPCNHLAKFPHPGVVMARYAEGATLLEAYWKSVAWPGEGVFVGEPLARPFAPRVVQSTEGHADLAVFSPEWKNLPLQGANSAIGPYRPVELYPIHPGFNDVRLKFPQSGAFYRMIP